MCTVKSNKEYVSAMKTRIFIVRSRIHTWRSERVRRSPVILNLNLKHEVKIYYIFKANLWPREGLKQLPTPGQWVLWLPVLWFANITFHKEGSISQIKGQLQVWYSKIPAALEYLVIPESIHYFRLLPEECLTGQRWKKTEC